MTILFLDRDGTLMEDVGYPRDPDSVRLLPGAAQAIRTLSNRGYIPIVISNQSGVARGLISHREFQTVHERFVEVFRSESGLTLPAYYCLHGPDDDCDCRKPKTGLFRKALADLKRPMTPAVMIGDKLSDVEAGRAIGARPILFTNSNEPINAPAVEVARSWKDVLRLLGE